jgi:hypothetical protein
MRTMFILAIAVAVCVCSEAEFGEESEEGRCNPTILQKASDDQAEREWRQHLEQKQRMQGYADHAEIIEFNERFEGRRREAELQEMVKRFEQREALIYALEEEWPLEEGPHLVSNRKKCLKWVFRYVLNLSPSSSKQVAKEAYSRVVSVAKSLQIKNEEVESTVEGLQEIYEELGWDRDESTREVEKDKEKESTINRPQEKVKQEESSTPE